LYPLGDLRNKAPEKSLDAEADYFAFHAHLRLYLYRRDGTFFEELSSDEARHEFQEFVRHYNTGNLAQGYYPHDQDQADGSGSQSYTLSLPQEALDQCKRTKHTWNFNTSATEGRSLDMVKEGVRKQTEYTTSAVTDAAADPSAPMKAGTTSTTGTATLMKNRPSGVQPQPRQIGPSRDGGPAATPADPTNNHNNSKKTPEQIAQERRAYGRLREDVKTTSEELAGGRKDGRERQIEKRQERAAVQHGAARDRESAAAGVELSDHDIYGGGGGSGGGKHDPDDFQRALSREKQRKAQHIQKRDNRIAELQQKEQDKQTQMLEMIGLGHVQPGQKIKIAPRND
jgi:hypothetical protein